MLLSTKTLINNQLSIHQFGFTLYQLHTQFLDLCSICLATRAVIEPILNYRNVGTASRDDGASSATRGRQA